MGSNKRFAICLLYTSDAADDMQCVDLGGRRIIKKMCRAPLRAVGACCEVVLRVHGQTIGGRVCHVPLGARPTVFQDGAERAALLHRLRSEATTRVVIGMWSPLGGRSAPPATSPSRASCASHARFGIATTRCSSTRSRRSAAGNRLKT